MPKVILLVHDRAGIKMKFLEHQLQACSVPPLCVSVIDTEVLSNASFPAVMKRR
jgi:DNA polymerase III alpha subunit (gram-positive type)